MIGRFSTVGLQGSCARSVGGRVLTGQEQVSSPGLMTPVLVQGGSTASARVTGLISSSTDFPGSVPQLLQGIGSCGRGKLGWITPSCSQACLLMYISVTALLTYMSCKVDKVSPVGEHHVASTSMPPFSSIGS